MAAARLIRGGAAPENSPALVIGSIKPMIPPRGALKALLAQMTDKTSLDNIDRLQRAYYALKNGDLLPLLDQFVGRFTNQADSRLNLAGGAGPVNNGCDWDATKGFVAPGAITVSANITLGSTAMIVAVAPAKPLRKGMVVIGTGITSSTTTIVDGPADGGAGTYTLSAPATATNAAAALTAGGWLGLLTPGSGRYLQNSAHIAFVLTGEPGATGTNNAFFGRFTGGADRLRVRIGSGGNTFVRINNSTTQIITDPVIPASGRIIINRPTATRFEVWRNGLLVYANDANPTDGIPGPLIFGRDNNTFQAAAFSALSIGGGLTPLQAAALDRALAAAG